MDIHEQSMPVFHAPGPNGELPGFEDLRPWLVSDLMGRADAASSAAAVYPGTFEEWDNNAQSAVYREAAGLVDSIPSTAGVRALLDTKVALECDNWQLTEFNRSDLAQRRDKQLHIRNGNAKAWAEVAALLGDAVGVLSAEPDKRITLYPRVLPSGRFEPSIE